MNGKGIALLAIAVVAIGTFALPSTVSLFSGQHTWYDLGAKGNDVPCEKCHADIAAEMEHVGPHTGETGYERLECEYCHRVFPIEHKNASFDTYTYASGDGAGAEAGKEAHAASTVPCMYCHSGNESDVYDWGRHDEESDCLSCHADDGLGPGYPPSIDEVHGNAKYFNNEDCYKCHLYKNGGIVTIKIPPAGGFGLTTNASDTGELAAHKTFVMNAISNTKMEDANEACIACHTHIPVKINWTHRVSLEFNATPEFELPPAHFNVTDWAVNGTANVTVYGNTTGFGATNSTYWPGKNPDGYSGGGY